MNPILESTSHEAPLLCYVQNTSSLQQIQSGQVQVLVYSHTSLYPQRLKQMTNLIQFKRVPNGSCCLSTPVFLWCGKERLSFPVTNLIHSSQTGDCCFPFTQEACSSPLTPLHYKSCLPHSVGSLYSETLCSDNKALKYNCIIDIKGNIQKTCPEKKSEDTQLSTDIVKKQ